MAGGAAAADGDGVLIASGREAVASDLAGALEGLGARVRVVSRPEAWPDRAPGLVFLDLADPVRPVREARLALGPAPELVAIVDNESVERLVPALAAGCGDYLFYPLNPSELRLRWRRHREGGGTGSRRPGELSGTLELEFPSQVRFVQDVVDEVVDACQRLAFGGPRATLNLRVALGEAISNAILYGNREDPAKRVRVRARLAADRARVTVADEGSGFDPSAVADPTLPGNRERPHGRGLFLLRSLADRVEFNEAGNAVTLTLRRAEEP